jgi:hypothetical protein
MAHLQGIDAMTDHSETELWSWKAVDGKMHYIPFGENSAFSTKSNALQGWSLVYMGNLGEGQGLTHSIRSAASPSNHKRTRAID